MPLYRCAIREGLSDEGQRGQIAKEVVRIHCGVTGAPASFVHAFFSERPASALPEGQAAFVLGSIRWGRTDDHPMPGIFSWIRIAYIDSFSTYPGPEEGQVPVGHAGRGETQLIMAGWPETVRMAALEGLAEKEGFSLDNVQTNSKVQEILAGELEKFSGAFKGYEKPRALSITTEDFTTENGMLTPSLKLKRRNVLAKYEDQLEALYG